MKNLALSLLMLVMFLPGLACARVMGGVAPPADAHAAPAPCHESSDGAPPPAREGMMLFKDCAKADLQQAVDAPSLKKPELGKVALTFALTPDFTAGGHGLPAFRQVIRGPPPDPAAVSASYPPVFLSTLRLRI